MTTHTIAEAESPKKIMPDETRTILKWAAVVIATFAALGNWGHVFKAATEKGKAEWWAAGAAATLPDILLVLCVIKLRYHRLSAWAWLGLATSIGFVTWSVFVALEGKGTFSIAVNLLPLWVAVLAAGLLETGDHKTGEPVPATAQVPAARGTRSPKPRVSGTRPRGTEVPGPEATGYPAASPRVPAPVARDKAPGSPAAPDVPGSPETSPAPGTAAERILSHLDRSDVRDATQAELVNALGLNPATIKKAMKGLRDSGMIIDSGRRSAYRRRPHLVSKAQ